jgi:hypothetical protein
MSIALDSVYGAPHRHPHQARPPTTTQVVMQAVQECQDSRAVRVRYLAIRVWWLSSGAAFEEGIRDLDTWFAFWHFRYRQWGGFMQLVSTHPLSISFFGVNFFFGIFLGFFGFFLVFWCQFRLLAYFCTNHTHYILLTSLKIS